MRSRPCKAVSCCLFCSPHCARDGKDEGGGDHGRAAAVGVRGVRLLPPRQVARVPPRGAEAYGAARALRPLLRHLHAARQAEGSRQEQARVVGVDIHMYMYRSVAAAVGNIAMYCTVCTFVQNYCTIYSESIVTCTKNSHFIQGGGGGGANCPLSDLIHVAVFLCVPG